MRQSRRIFSTLSSQGQPVESMIGERIFSFVSVIGFYENIFNIEKSLKQ